MLAFIFLFLALSLCSYNPLLYLTVISSGTLVLSLLSLFYLCPAALNITESNFYCNTANSINVENQNPNLNLKYVLELIFRRSGKKLGDKKNLLSIPKLKGKSVCNCRIFH